MQNSKSSAQPESYKWFVLALSTFTFTFVVAIPSMSMPVLFDEISSDLKLNLVQVGWIWGLGSMLAIIVGLIGGPIGDRFGPRRTLAVACLLVGAAGAARGFSDSFPMLAFTSLVTGFAQWAIPMNVHKTCGVWFPNERLGLANGVVAVGMAFGFLLGSLLAATVFSPLFGGWRNVMYVYGAVAAIFGILWWVSSDKVAPEDQKGDQKIIFAEAIGHVIRLRDVWILCIATAGVSGCVNGLLGYLALHLRGLGWAPALADSTLASFHAISMIFAIPIALLSDRIGNRRGILAASAILIGIGTGLVGISNGVMISVAVLIAGLSRDGFMAITMTAAMEVKGVGARYAGTATGLIMTMMGFVNVFSPPIGNWLAQFGSGPPFIFWAALVISGSMGLIFQRFSGKTSA